MIYLYALIALVLLWVINTAIGIKIGKIIAETDLNFYNNSVKNSNNIFYCLFGIVGVAISYYIFDLFKWIVTGYYLLMFVISFALFVFSFVTQIIFAFKNKTEWLVILSNFLSIMGDAVVLLLAYRLLW